MCCAVVLSLWQIDVAAVGGCLNSEVCSSHPAATAAAVQKIIAVRTAAAVAPFLFFLFFLISVFRSFYLEISVKARTAAVAPFLFFSFFHDFCFSEPFILNLVLKRLSRPV